MAGWTRRCASWSCKVSTCGRGGESRLAEQRCVPPTKPAETDVNPTQTGMNLEMSDEQISQSLGESPRERGQAVTRREGVYVR
jgi:hypothetical protein